MPTRINHYDQGDVWTPQATFTVGGTPTDPTNITVKIKKPDGTTSTLGPVAGGTGGAGIIRTGAGVFKTDIALDDVGYWFARFEGTGSAAATEEHQAVVDPSEFYGGGELSSRALVSMAETKDWLQVQNIDTVNDMDLARVINDVSDRIHQEAGREFKAYGTNPATRVFPVDALGPTTARYIDGQYMGETGQYSRTIEVGDLAALTSVQIVSSNDWTTVLESVAAGSITSRPTVRAPWEPIRCLEFQTTVTKLYPGMRVSVTGTWGFPVVPGNIRQATLDAIAAVFDRDVEHYRQDLGAVGGEGGGTTVIQTGGRLLALPPSAAAVAWSYRDPAIR